MSDLDTLLELQEHDTHVDQLRHRKAALPERAELAELEQRRTTIERQRADVAARRDEIAERETQAEREIAASEKRISEIDTRMRSGAVSASRELQAMQGEIDHIKERVSTLEDAALEAMDEREPLDTQIDQFDAQLAEIDARATELRNVIAATERDIDGEVAAEEGTRQQLAERVPAPLLKTYEGLRVRLGGIGAARLDGNRCTGCHLTLPATEIDRLRREPMDTLVFCDQCGRILVRTH